MLTDPYTIYAVQYASRQAKSNEVFYGDFHDSPLPMAYFVWVITNPSRTVVVDLGFTIESGRKRGRQMGRPIDQGLRLLDVDPAAIEHVVLTHFHYDHVGNYTLFPRAKFWIQDEEMRIFTGRYVRFYPYNQLAEADDICALVRLNYDGRLRFVDGDKEVWPGISVHKVGGHAPGLQVVRVWTRRGYAVVASDAVHYYRNLEAHIPFYLTHHVGQAQDAFDRVMELVDEPGLVFPGHDPSVLDRFEHVQDGIVRLG